VPPAPSPGTSWFPYSDVATIDPGQWAPIVDWTPGNESWPGPSPGHYDSINHGGDHATKQQQANTSPANPPGG
jgi:hypothetical protein